MHNACIPGAAECDFDVCKNVLRSSLALPDPTLKYREGVRGQRKCKVNSCKADITECIFVHNACIPGAAECDFDVCKNILRSSLALPDPTLKYREGVRGQAHQ